MFSAADRAQLDDVGLPIEEAERQLKLFADPPPALRLDRPCRLGDGISELGSGERAAANDAYEHAARDGRLCKFVPASGAATRMFQSLLALRDSAGPITRAALAARADEDANAREALTFVDGLDRFPFAAPLRAAVTRAGYDGADVETGDLRPLFDALLDRDGLHYGRLPKALLLFHRDGSGARTAFEEHLIEGATYGRGRDGRARFHFTVSPEHQADFDATLARVRADCEARTASRLDVGFSTQKRSTDTLAADGDNQPFRDAEGRLVIRPGGHGALIENLNDLAGDVVFVKTIDNLQPEDRRGPTLEWMRLLTGHLLVLRRQLASLDRPMRVVGVVRNTGEPGGGPFWVREPDGTESLQIIESAQVDQRDAGQKAVFADSTHFNPVFMACGVRDRAGRPFDLRKFVDPAAVFISRKSKDGRALQALELPGLWNGAMSRWHTVFVEVPLDAFTPVKTINDLLRPAHQPSEGGTTDEHG